MDNGKPEFKGRCFVMQPFDNGKFDKRFTDVFEPAIRAALLEPYRVDRDPGVEIPIQDIERGISECDLCFAEITLDNPNVWFELGYAIASGKPTCLVCSEERTTHFPFDIQHRAVIRYSVSSPSDFKTFENQITLRLIALLKKQQNLNAIKSLKPTAKAEGLTPHEISVLVLIMSHFDSLGVSPWELKQDMQKAGYTDGATGLAIEKLKRAKRIEMIEVDGQSDPYMAWGLTDLGREWLIANENQLNLHLENKPTKQKAKVQAFKEDDIPF